MNSKKKTGSLSILKKDRKNTKKWNEESKKKLGKPNLRRREKKWKNAVLLLNCTTKRSKMFKATTQPIRGGSKLIKTLVQIKTNIKIMVKVIRGQTNKLKMMNSTRCAMLTPL
jgi:hypothetical protein